MAQDNMEIYNLLKQPPRWALKKIEAGRLRGKSDISPQWRYQAMTEVYGPCGVGWKFTIDCLWQESGPDNQIFVFARISLWVAKNEKWSDPIPGIGGHMLIVKEKAGLHANDEAYKMAVTDALSTAMKMLGVAADIYAGHWDGSKYAQSEPATKQPSPAAKPKDPKQSKSQEGSKSFAGPTADQLKLLNQQIHLLGLKTREDKINAVNKWRQRNRLSSVESTKDIPRQEFSRMLDEIKAKVTEQTGMNATAEPATEQMDEFPGQEQQEATE